ncbi:MAG: hypothetical protein GX556_11985 [Fibrobacter sp.]|nr:hypothetical protein [Fibrobacter sp.]
MKLRNLYLAAILVIAGCSSYKQLKPKPELSPAESGYIELMSGKKNFELKKGKKYFLSFPSPQEDNFYLVLNIKQKEAFNSSFTSELIDKKRPGEKIKDESTTDTQSVYPIHKNSSGYYFLVDKPQNDVILQVEYRYAPQWRFRFENKHLAFKEIFKNNEVDRSTYKSIGSGYHLDGVNFAKAIDTVKSHSSELGNVYKELLAIESIFPAGIVNSKDEAYENYKALKSDLEEEMEFQANYLSVLDFFNKEFACRGNPSELVKSVDAFISFFELKAKLPSTVISEAQTVIGGRLNEVVPFYDQRLSGKEDAKQFDNDAYLIGQLYRIGVLYKTAGLTTPADYIALEKFVKEFDTRSQAYTAAKEQLGKINDVVAKLNQMPSNGFFKEAATKTSGVQSRLPSEMDQPTFGKYIGYRCTGALNADIKSLADETGRVLRQYKEAETLVPQLNSYKDQKDYSTMLAILKQNSHLNILIEKYRPLDKMSVEEQSHSIGAALNNNQWSVSEEKLRKLHEDINFLNPAEIFPFKSSVVEELEDSLYTRIDRVSRYSINKFLEENVNTLENIDSLYSDSVFLPVYDVTFSSGSKKELAQRKADLIAHLGKMKENEFPAKAISLLYEQFMAKPNDNGVAKARAVVTHGKHYTGDDKKIKQRIAECDPLSAKWIVKPKDYRRVFAVPITDNKRGKNKYVVRFMVDIPTEANFPVYDVNIKLPKEIAENAATEQWYDEISLNKRQLKNEGRFVITAPSASNNYECQITPVQMTKGKGNILEISFYHSSFRVHSLSVMVQKPIIKKN